MPKQEGSAEALQSRVKNYSKVFPKNIETSGRVRYVVYFGRILGTVDSMFCQILVVSEYPK